MDSKLVRTVKVETWLTEVSCVAPRCKGVLKHDGKTRSQGGVHGGPLEYRHLCTVCKGGLWLAEVFPKVEYREVEKPVLTEYADV